MSKIKIQKYIPSKESLKVKQNESINKEKKQKKIRFFIGFYFFFKILGLIIIITGLIYYLYLKNFFRSQEKFQNSLVFIERNFFIIKEKIILFSDLSSQNKSGFNSLNNQNIKQNIKHEFVNIFRNKLSSQNLVFKSASEIDKDGDLKIFLEHSKDGAGYIYLNINKNSPEEIWLNFISALASQDFKNLLEKNLQNLEYIDLRFGNKVFYKFYSETDIENL